MLIESGLAGFTTEVLTRLSKLYSNLVNGIGKTLSYTQYKWFNPNTGLNLPINIEQALAPIQSSVDAYESLKTQLRSNELAMLDQIASIRQTQNESDIARIPAMEEAYNIMLTVDLPKIVSAKNAIQLFLDSNYKETTLPNGQVMLEAKVVSGTTAPVNVPTPEQTAPATGSASASAPSGSEGDVGNEIKQNAIAQIIKNPITIVILGIGLLNLFKGKGE